MNAIKRLFCAAEYAKIERLSAEVSKLRDDLIAATAQLSATIVTAARLEAEKKELVYQLDGTRKQVRALRKRSRRH